MLLFLGPGRDALNIFCLVAAVELAPVDTGTFNNRVDFPHAAGPLLLHGGDEADDLLMARGQGFVRRRGGFNYRGFTLQVTIDGPE